MLNSISCIGTKLNIGTSFLDSIYCGLIYALLVSILSYILALSLEVNSNFQNFICAIFAGLILFSISEIPISLFVADIFQIKFLRAILNFSRFTGTFPTVFKLIVQTGVIFSLLPFLAIGSTSKISLSAVNLGTRRKELYGTFLFKRAIKIIAIIFIFAFTLGFSAPNCSDEITGFYSLSDLNDDYFKSFWWKSKCPAQMVSVILLVISIILISTTLLIKSPFRHISMNYLKKTKWPRYLRSGVFQKFKYFPFTLLIIIFLYLVFKLISSWGLRNGVTVSWSNSSYLFEIVFFSIWIATISAFISIILSVPVAYYQTVKFKNMSNYVLLLAVLPILIPQSTFALSAMKMTLWLKHNFGIPKHLLLITFLALKGIPFTYFISFACFQSLGKKILLAGRNLGTNYWRTFFRITWPNSWPFIIAAFFMSFATILNDYSLSSYLTSTKKTLGVWMKQSLSVGDRPEVWFLITIFLIFELLAIGLFIFLGIKNVKKRNLNNYK